jgi:hypothetical protein
MWVNITVNYMMAKEFCKERLAGEGEGMSFRKVYVPINSRIRFLSFT